MLHASRTPTCQLQGKATRSGPGLVSRRVIRQRAQAFKGSRRALVTVAAAESEAAPAPAARAPRANARPLSSIEPNETFEGRVTSVQSFGAFVDIGAESQGLVHVSQLADGYVKNVADVVKVGDTIKVKVLSVDAAGKRLALTRKGLGIRAPAAARAAEMEEAEEADEVVAEDPSSAELDGLTFVVEDEEEEDTGDIDPASLEFVEELSAEDAREIAIALEDIVHGTVAAVDSTGVTVKYQLEDGTEVEGLIHVSELLAPSHLVESGEDAADEAEAYTEVDNIDPAAYYKVGESISCFVMDVEDGTPLLTQRPPEEAADVYEFLEDLEEQDVDKLSDATLIQGMWLAAENAAGDKDDEAENGDALLEQLDPIEGAVAEAADGNDEDGLVSVVPEELRLEVLEARRGGASRSGQLVGPLLGLNLPDRPVGYDPSSGVSANLLEAFNADVDEDESECIGVAYNDTSYVPASLLKRLGYKIVKGEGEGGEWAVERRQAAEEAEAELDDELDDELEAVAAGLYDQRAIDAIVKDLMADDDADEAEVPRLARRNPIVAAAAVSAGISAAAVSALRKKTGAGMMDCKKALTECGGDSDKAVEWLRQKGLSGADKKAGRVAAEGAIVRYIHPGSRLGVLLEVNCETDFVAAGEVFNGLANELAMVVASSDVACVSVEDLDPAILAKEREVEMGKEDLKSKPEAVRAKIVEGRLEKIKKNFALLEQPALRDNNKTVAEIIKETIAATGENIQVRRFVKFNLGEGLEKKSTDFAAEVAQQTQAKKAEPKKEEPKKEQKQEQEAAAKPAVAISAGLVKQLRDKSGAGMMDCKKALAECNGDIEEASEWLRKKGLASADKKAGRLAAEGGVIAYIHPGSRLGVLLEINCETDFVAAGETFNKLANSVAMQIAASPTVEYVSSEEIPADVFEKEKEIEMGREDLQSKPEAIRAKIAEGRVKKLVQERVLLEQPYLLDGNKTVAEAVKEAIAACGENIQIRRFERFVLGEGIEKKVSDLAAEVAAATGKQ